MPAPVDIKTTQHHTLSTTPSHKRTQSKQHAHICMHGYARLRRGEFQTILCLCATTASQISQLLVICQTTSSSTYLIVTSRERESVFWCVRCAPDASLDTIFFYRIRISPPHSNCVCISFSHLTSTTQYVPLTVCFFSLGPRFLVYRREGVSPRVKTNSGTATPYSSKETHTSRYTLLQCGYLARTNYGLSSKTENYHRDSKY